MKDFMGDKRPRPAPSQGSSLAEGLSEQVKISESPDALGMGRGDPPGPQKPKGPQKTTSGGQRFA